MQRVIIFFSLFVFTVSVVRNAESRTYKIASFPVPLMVEDNEHGIFVELFKEAAKRTGEQFEFAVYPTQRTQKLFQDGDIDGFFPASDKSAGEKAAKSVPFYSKNNVVFVRKGTPFITDVAQLEGKILGVTKGYTYGKEITENPKITLEYADSDVLNMKKLSKGRVDGFIVEEQSGLKALEESGSTDIEYDPQKPISSVGIYFAFQDTEEGRMLAEKFSKALEEMKADGAFEKIMNPSR